MCVTDFNLTLSCNLSSSYFVFTLVDFLTVLVCDVQRNSFDSLQIEAHLHHGFTVTDIIKIVPTLVHGARIMVQSGHGQFFAPQRRQQAAARKPPRRLPVAAACRRTSGPAAAAAAPIRCPLPRQSAAARFDRRRPLASSSAHIPIFPCLRSQTQVVS